MGRQQVQTNNLLEVGAGKSLRPLMSTNALSPSAGSIIKSPPKITQLIAVDYQQTTLNTGLTYTAGNYYLLNFATIGFTGLMSAAQRYFGNSTTTVTNIGSPTIVNTVASNISPLVVGQTTQLLLDVAVQTFAPMSDMVPLQGNLQTQARDNITQTPLYGPWFPSGTTYLAFSCTPSMFAYCITSTGVAYPMTLGITAKLFAIFTQ